MTENTKKRGRGGGGALNTFFNLILNIAIKYLSSKDKRSLSLKENLQMQQRVQLFFVIVLDETYGLDAFENDLLAFQSNLKSQLCVTPSYSVHDYTQRQREIVREGERALADQQDSLS